MHKLTKEAWEDYRDAELARAQKALTELGYSLDSEQVHIGGERYLQSGYKLVLVGRRVSDQQRVIAKVSSHADGMREIKDEHERRHVLHRLDFAYLPFYSPEELLYAKHDGLRISVSEFIEEEKGFLQHSPEEQFFLALGAFKAQEGVHATTAAHARTIRGAFGMKEASDYLNDFAGFVRAATQACPNDATLARQLAQSASFLTEHAEIIDAYAGFLTHTDFVPHNLRIRDGHIFLLDHTSLTFGNKYESWARFLNYMNLYHPELERSLSEYVRLNRSNEEYLALRVMRVYKLGFLFWFYADSLARTNGNLQELAKKRIAFWGQVLEAVLADKPLVSGIVDIYTQERDALRSDEEKLRQRTLNQLS